MQGYGPEIFDRSTNPVGSKWLSEGAPRGIPTLGVTLRKDEETELIGP